MKNAKPPLFRPSYQEDPVARRKRLRDAHDATRPSAAERGYDAAWFRLRAAFIRMNPYCAACAAEGVQRKADVVDHVLSIRERPDLRLSVENLMPMCHQHHGAKTARQDGSWGRPRRL